MQTQKLQNAQNQIQREIQYFIFQDLENALCQLGQLEETIEKLEKLNDYSYLPIAMNKAILQANLSLGIHFDQYSQHNKKEGNFLKYCKTQAKSIFQKALDQKIIQNVDPKVKVICDFYVNKLLGDTDIYSVQELQLVKVETKGQFNQKALEKVIWGTQAVDKQLRQVQNNEYKPPDAQEIFKNILISKKYCGEQLIKNFSKPTNNNSTQKKQDLKPNLANQSNNKNKQQFVEIKKVCIEAQQTMDEEFEKEQEQNNMKIQNQQKGLKQNKTGMQQEKIKQPPAQKCVNSNNKPIKNESQIMLKKETERIVQRAENNKGPINQARSKTLGINQQHKNNQK